MNLKPKTFVANLLAEAWAMEPARLRAFVTDLVEFAPMVDHQTIKAAKEMPGAEGPGYSVADGVAHIPIKGVILKDVPCVFRFFGVDATSTKDTGAALDRALADDDVDEITLDVDSPGGTVAGVQELADKIFNARGQKPLNASIEDLAASAAYWLASQTDKIESNAAGAVGSIGVYTVVDDYSRALENKGIKTHVVSSHELKGVGVEGAPVTDAQLADIKRNILDYAELFNAAVSRGRGLEQAQVKQVATGQVWLGEEARQLGLIDTIRETATAGIGSTVVEKQTPPVGKGKDSVMLDKKADVPTANPAADQELRAELEQARAEAERAKAEAEATRAVIAELKAQQMQSLLARFEDRVAPAAKAAIEKLGGQMSSADFEEYLQALPVVTRTDRISVDTQKATDAAKQYVADEGERALAKAMGVSIPHHRKLDAYGEHVDYVKFDGTVVLYDGREIAKEDLDKVLGLN